MSDLEKIKARREAIKATRFALDREDEELAVAERVISRLGNGASRGAAISGAPKSQRDYILATLRGSAKPWVEGSRELQELIETVYRVKIPMNSLQPMIWNLTNKEKLIKRDGRKIALAERV